MNKIISFIFLLMLLVTMIGCEKRMVLDKDFPHESSKLFCELIGFPERGFIGTISKIKTVQGKESTSVSVQISIWEDNKLIIDEMIHDDFLIPYNVDVNHNYKMEINYKNAIIRSQSSSVILPKMEMNNFLATNDFIDSLGIHVIQAQFDFKNSESITDSIYYVPNFSLNLLNDDFTKIGEFMKPKSILPNKTVYFNRRIANQFNYHAFRMNLFIIDRALFEYLKYIVQLGQIPNDNIEGHHGNILGGVGYFGIINYDSRFVYL